MVEAWPATRPGTYTNPTATEMNTHGAAGSTTRHSRGWASPRMRGRLDRESPEPAGPGAPRPTVSGVRAARTSAAAAPASCGRYGSIVGSGAHCASAPATSGPAANPSVIAPLARRAPAPGAGSPYGGADSSLIHAAPTLNAVPLPSPTTSRPANSHPAPSVPAISTALPIIEVTSANSMTRRRPMRSDSEPPASRPGTSPIAYNANMASATGADRPSRARYSSSMGVN